MGLESIFKSVAAPVIGGLLGSGSTGGSTGSQTQTKTTDPRLDRYLYGEDGKGGLLGDAAALYQGNKSGLNQQMIDGLNRQYQIYSDPNTSAGYTQIANTGLGLLGPTAASNPFSNGQASLQVPRPGMGGQYQAPMTQNPGMQQPQAQQPLQIANPGAPQAGGAMGGQAPFSLTPAPVAQAPMQQPAQQPANAEWLDYLKSINYAQLPQMTGVNADLSGMGVNRDWLQFGNGG